MQNTRSTRSPDVRMPVLPRPRSLARLLARSLAALVAPLLAALHAVARPAAAQPLAHAARAAWTRGATCYEIFVRSFADSDGDGVGDLNGLTARLDYLNDGDPRTTRDLGVRCVWLMPVAESPSYHGYDVSDYYRVARAYGTNADFRRFVREAHRRGVRVLVDLVLNHASSDHPYFRAALRDPASPYRAWFRFSATKPEGQRPLGQDAWHRSPVRDEYYYGAFYREMPDWNYDTPAVRAEADRVARFWVREMGVDGFRLDAVSFLVEEGPQLVGTAGTHRVLRDFAAHLRRVKPDAYTVGEATWDSLGVLLPYYPDQLDGYFAFEASDSLLAAVRTGRAAGLLAPALRLQALLPADRYATFLRNHDQPRTATVLGGDAAGARLAATLLLTLPGLPFVYYGEELGVAGDKPDERIRTPMAWGPGAHAGFTRGTPWEPLQPDSLTANVAAQDADPRSLLALYRRLIRLRAAEPALTAGALVPLAASSDRVAAYLRRDRSGAVLVVANLDTTPREGVTLTSAPGALRAGRYAPRPLLDSAAAAPLGVGADGRLAGYAPVATLAPRTAYVFALTTAAPAGAAARGLARRRTPSAPAR